MLKTKEEILKEFDEMSEIEEFWGLPYDHLVDKVIKQFISDLIAKTREETIREVDKLINNEYIIKDIYKNSDDLLNDIKKEINKLKK